MTIGFFYYPVTMVAGLFPWSLFLVAAGVAMYKKLKWKAAVFEYYLLSWILIVFVVFQLAHSKIGQLYFAVISGPGFIDRRIYRGAIVFFQDPAVEDLYGGWWPDHAPSGSRCFLAAYPTYKNTFRPSRPCISFPHCWSLWPGEWSSVFKGKNVPCPGGHEPVLIAFLWTAFMIKRTWAVWFLLLMPPSMFRIIRAKRPCFYPARPYARGFEVLHGEEIAVLDINGSNYFSPHPIPILNTSGQIGGIFASTEIDICGP